MESSNHQQCRSRAEIYKCRNPKSGNYGESSRAEVYILQNQYMIPLTFTLGTNDRIGYRQFPCLSVISDMYFTLWLKINQSMSQKRRRS